MRLALCDMSDQENIEKAKLPITKRHYIELGTAIAILIAVIGGVYSYVNKALETKRELESLQVAYDDLNGKYGKSEHELSVKRHALELAKLETPFQVLPANECSIVEGPTGIHGPGSIEIVWEDTPQANATTYELVIHRATVGASPKRIRIPRPEERRLSIPLDGYGIFYWKIGDATRNRWSDYRSFGVYPSVLERVKATQRLMVARTDDFPLYDDGTTGFEHKLVQWIASELGTRLGIRNLQMELKLVEWCDIFHTIQRADADIAIANITKSKKREEIYKPVRFTVGYLANHQMLLCRNDRHYPDFPAGMRGKVVGAHAKSINLKAARALGKRYQFTVDGTQRSYADVLNLLLDGSVDFALIDSGRYAESASRLRGRFACYGPSGSEFDEILREFYEGELGYPFEEFAIAVHDPLGETAGTETLRSLINSILESAEGKAKLKSLKEVYVSVPSNGK